MIENEPPVKKRSDETYGQETTNPSKKNSFAGFVPAAFRDHVPLLYAVNLWNNIIEKQKSGFLLLDNNTESLHQRLILKDMLDKPYDNRNSYGATMAHVNRAYDAIMPINDQLAILQCTASYPADFDQLNLQVITTFRKRFANTIIGLSSHDNGIAMAVAAYMPGARIIEKHFTLNHTLKGTDHAFSLEPTGLRKMVAARGLPRGHAIRPEDIAFKSPGDGLPPYEFDKVVGRTTICDLKVDDNLTFEVLNGVELRAKAVA